MIMPAIIDQVYHKGINKNYSNLYIRLQIDNVSIFTDDISTLLSMYFTENKIPFESKKQYEIFVFPDYIRKTESANAIKNN